MLGNATDVVIQTLGNLLSNWDFQASKDSVT